MRRVVADLLLTASRVNPAALKKLATEEDVADVFALYAEFFSSISEDHIDLQNQQPRIAYQFGEPVDGSDPGVEIEMGLSPEDLEHNLGFLDGIMCQSNHFRHLGGLNSWDAEHAKEFEPERAENNPDMKRLTLHWHQKAGLHGINRKLCSPTPSPDGCTGVLIADDVGLGKTWIAITEAALLSENVTRQESGVELAPIFREFSLYALLQ